MWEKLTAIRESLGGTGSVWPWVILFLAMLVSDWALVHFKVYRWLAKRYSWGSNAQLFINSAPMVIAGAMFNVITTGGTDFSSVCKGALVGAIVKAFTLQVPKPPTGPGGQGMVALLLITTSGALSGCAGSCHDAADASALRAYETECYGYKDTKECPTGDDIEARHKAAQEACK